VSIRRAPPRSEARQYESLLGRAGRIWKAYLDRVITNIQTGQWAKPQKVDWLIRKALENSYRKTVGALWAMLRRSTGAVGNNWGALQFLYLLGIIALMAGFVNAVVLPVPNQAQAIYPGPGAESIPETFIDGMVILLGGAGIYLTYISGRQTTRSRMVNLYLGFALLLISISVMMGLYLVTVKG